MILFDLTQLLEEGIVGLIRELRGVPNVVEIVVALNEGAQLGGSIGGFHRRDSNVCTEGLRGSLAGLSV
jgi:hypothetical protein